MKKLLSILLCASFSIHAAQLTAGYGVELLAINGQSTEKMSDHAEKSLELMPGAYQIVVRYETEVKRGSKSALFTSKPYVLDLKMGNEDADISIPSMRFESQAQAYFRNPTWLLSVNGKQTRLTGEELEGIGFAGYRNIEEALAHFNQSPNSIEGQINKPPTVPSMTPKVAQAEPFNMTQMKQWYLNASAAERKAFKRWMIEADG